MDRYQLANSATAAGLGLSANGAPLLLQAHSPERQHQAGVKRKLPPPVSMNRMHPRCHQFGNVRNPKDKSLEIMKFNSPTKLLMTLAAMSTFIVSVAISAQPAEAGRKSCVYRGYDRFTKLVAAGVSGHAKAAKKKWACNRAKRKCLRSLRKAWKHGGAQRASCVRFENRLPVL